MWKPVMMLTWGFFAVWAFPAHATLMVSVGNANMNEGGETWVDVMVSGTGDLQDVLDSFGFDFRITTLTGVGRVDFVDPQPVSYLTDPLANYVFYNNSGVAANPPVSVGNVSGVNVPNDTFRGGDYTNGAPDVSISTPQLLARLKVVGAGGALAPQIGDTFQVSLEPTPGFTSFLNSSLVDVNYSASSGIITNVPEPSTLVALLSGGLFVGVLQGRRVIRRFRRNTPATADNA